MKTNKHKPAFLSSGTTGRPGDRAPTSLCEGIKEGRLGKGGSPSRVSPAHRIHAHFLRGAWISLRGRQLSIISSGFSCESMKTRLIRFRCPLLWGSSLTLPIKLYIMYAVAEPKWTILGRLLGPSSQIRITSELLIWRFSGK